LEQARGLKEHLMTPQERELITGLFERMRGFGAPAKDREAETLIIHSVGANSNALYMLVQTTLIQEQALEAANNRLREAEEQVRTLEEEQQRRPSGPGSFLGGLFGGRRTTEPALRTPPPHNSQSPWSVPPSQDPPTAPPAPGGFMHSAMTTAAGVAGGMLAAGAIRDMLGSAHASPTNTEQARRDHETLARQDVEDDAQSDAADKDARDDARADAEDDADAADDAADSEETAI
jgi:uncharacterized protein